MIPISNRQRTERGKMNDVCRFILVEERFGLLAITIKARR